MRSGRKSRNRGTQSVIPDVANWSTIVTGPTGQVSLIHVENKPNEPAKLFCASHCSFFACHLSSSKEVHFQTKWMFYTDKITTLAISICLG